MPIPFAAQLEAYGPEKSWPRFSLAQARRYCRQLAKSHYENFLVASLLLPADIRGDFFPIYAYCRWADNLADEVESSIESLRLLDWWEEQLLTCARSPRHPVFVALGELIERREIPLTPFTDLLKAFRQDQTKLRYESMEELLDYCRYSANPVGRMILYLGDCFDERNALESDRICTALQLVNFWQDIARDFQMGRVYVPQESLAAHGIAADSFPMPEASAGFRRMLRQEVERAESLFAAGRPLAARAPTWLQIDIELFIEGGLAVANAIRKQDFDVWRHRPVVGRWTRLQMIISAMRRHYAKRWFGGQHDDA